MSTPSVSASPTPSVDANGNVQYWPEVIDKTQEDPMTMVVVAPPADGRIGGGNGVSNAPYDYDNKWFINNGSVRMSLQIQYGPAANVSFQSAGSEIEDVDVPGADSAKIYVTQKSLREEPSTGLGSREEIPTTCLAMVAFSGERSFTAFACVRSDDQGSFMKAAELMGQTKLVPMSTLQQ